MEEVWKPIKGYEGRYEVSSFGRVKSLARSKSIYETFLSNRCSLNNYIGVVLFTNGKRKNLLVHRLVAEAFIPNPENKKTVNHINGVKNDNRVENLEWATYSENNKHAHNTGLNKCGSEHGRSVLTEEQVIEMRSLYQKIKVKDIAKKYKVSRITVQNICLRKTWKHI